MHHFVADEHLGHFNIIQYCNRPFSSVEEMDDTIIGNHNEVVGKKDIVIHAGDFTMKKHCAEEYIKRLNGKHIFLQGNHDKWLKKSAPQILHMKIEGQDIVICHYAMRVWHKSHYNSWMCFGHSHSMLEPIGKQHDIGVDNNNFYPVSFDQLKSIMDKRPDNFNKLKDAHT